MANLRRARRFAFDREIAAPVRWTASLGVAIGGHRRRSARFVGTESVPFAAVGGHLVAVGVGVVSLAARLSVTEGSDASEQDDY